MPRRNLFSWTADIGGPQSGTLLVATLLVGMTNQIVIRAAAADDIPEILQQRKLIYEDMGHGDRDALSSMVSTSKEYLAQAIPAGSFRGWFATIDKKSCSRRCGHLSSLAKPHLRWRVPARNILNVYTYPEFRRRGIARQLMQLMIEWCRNQGITICHFQPRLG